MAAGDTFACVFFFLWFPPHSEKGSIPNVSAVWLFLLCACRWLWSWTLSQSHGHLAAVIFSPNAIFTFVSPSTAQGKKKEESIVHIR